MLVLPLELINMTYNFAYSTKELFGTNNHGLCVQKLKYIRNLNLTNIQHKLIARRLIGEACRGGNYHIIKLLIEYIKTFEYNGETDKYWRTDKICSVLTDGFHQAAKKNCKTTIRILNSISRQNSLDCIQSYFEGMCEYGNLDIIKNYLKIHMKNSSTLCKKGLLYACLAGHLKIVKYLYQKISYTDQIIIFEAMRYTCINNHTHILEYLIECSNMLPILLSHGFYGAGRGNSMDMINTLCDLNPVPMYDSTLTKVARRYWWHGFRGACRGGHFDLAKFIFSKLISFTDQQTRGMINLNVAYACIGGNMDIIELIMKEYKKINITVDLNQWLCIACSYANIELIHYILLG